MGIKKVFRVKIRAYQIDALVAENDLKCRKVDWIPWLWENH